ncbi:DUF3489 domain-containing protein [Defluviimonas sp. SAOS-178_SWC]|uniref:DUF3489 domain-containing protein n=1 Tax=Defluviimonas sp. SAOS-178_SWC TaxID=3121287 RepID=UPI0032220260
MTRTTTLSSDQVPAATQPGAQHSDKAAPGAQDTHTGADAPARTGQETPLRVTRLDQLVTLLRRPQGATLAELCEATRWQAHSVRGALAGALKRKGHAIAAATADGTRRYRIGDPA